MRFGEDVTERRQRAREAFENEAGYPVHTPQSDIAGVEAAIEAATRVRLTSEILRAAALKYPVVEEIVKAAFREAGFEVVE